MLQRRGLLCPQRTASLPGQQLLWGPLTLLVLWHDKAVAVFSLGRAVASFPKHKNGFWLEVAMAVGSRSAAECQQKYVEEQQARGSKRQAKSSTMSDKRQWDTDVLVLGISFLYIILNSGFTLLWESQAHARV